MTLLTTSPTTRFRSPDDHTAPEPPEYRGLRRDGVRLMIARPDGIEHRTFSDIGDYLKPGDVLVINTSATLAGQLPGRTESGAEIIVHLANRLEDGTRVVELRTAPRAERSILDAGVGDRINLPDDGQLELLAPYPVAQSSPTGTGSRLWRATVRVPDRLQDYLNRYGRPISYGYLRQSYPVASYQTIFALSPGSAEMPSAGRPFSPELVTSLVSRGVSFAPITLHTGVSSQEAREAPQPEWFEVTDPTAQVINNARNSGGRVIAVGTTATRALESAGGRDGVVRARKGWTDLVISSRRPVRVVSGLITGWHNPEASHLLLVEAVAGAELTQQAYDEAVRERYLWHEFGDSCLLLP